MGRIIAGTVLQAMMLLALPGNTSAVFNAPANWSLPEDQDSQIEPNDGCSPDKRIINDFSNFSYKQKYRIGVHAIRGFDVATELYHEIFSNYLTATAGQRFSPPIEFEMVPYTFEGVLDGIKAGDVDFLYANPSAYSCIGTEVGASSLATVISRVEVRDTTYDLDVFGGVIMTRADNSKVNTIQDLKDKVIAAGSISVLMSAQLQFYTMQRAGLSYINDPKQVVFTGNQFDVVEGVLNGDFEVGLVRTDQIERHTDANGVTVDPDSFKIVDPKINVMGNGQLFPFLHSTPIYPEWPLASMNSVPTDVSFEVQEALLAVAKHSEVGQHYEECQDLYGLDRCKELNFPYDFAEVARCDTTLQIAQLALSAIRKGKMAGFRTTRSYFELRTMQEEAGFLLQDRETGNWHCTRASSLYDGIQCPEGHFKRSRQEFDEACGREGLECKEGYECYCKPCIKAFEVDVYPSTTGDVDYHLVDYFGTESQGCEKMSICGGGEQGKPITFRIYDNKERTGVEFSVLLHTQDRTTKLPVTNIPDTFAYEFTVIEQRVQVLVVEVFVDGKQISQSPIRVETLQLDCDASYGENSKREPDQDGNCVCENNTYEILDTCIQSPYFF